MGQGSGQGQGLGAGKVLRNVEVTEVLECRGVEEAGRETHWPLPGTICQIIIKGVT